MLQQNFSRNIWGWIIAVLALLSALNSTYFFLAMAHSGVYGWLMVNSCAPSIFIFFLAFVFRNPVLLGISTIMMLRYGTGGLFVFSWSGTNLFAQMGHILMTLAALYSLWAIYKSGRWKKFILGVIIGAVVLIIYGILQHLYFTAHPGMLEQLFKGNY